MEQITYWLPPVEVTAKEDLDKVPIPDDGNIQLALVGPNKVPYAYVNKQWVLMQANAWWYPVEFLKSANELNTVEVADGTSRFAVVGETIYVWHPKLKRWISLDEELCPNCGYFIWE